MSAACDDADDAAGDDDDDDDDFFAFICRRVIVKGSDSSTNKDTHAPQESHRFFQYLLCRYHPDP